MEKMILREFKMKYENGEFSGSDFDTQVRAEWYDWFCPTEELAVRLNKLWSVLKGVESDFVLNNFSLTFKNNCPAMGPLYDDVRFDPIEPDKYEVDPYFVVAVDDKRDPCKYTVYTARNNYHAEFATNDLAEVHRFINTWELHLRDTDYENHEEELKHLCDEVITEMEDDIPTINRGEVLDAYRELRSWIDHRHGPCARLMLKASAGEVWADLFLDEGDTKVYADDDIYPIPLDRIRNQASCGHPVTENEVADAICAWCQEKMAGKEADPDE